MTTNAEGTAGDFATDLAALRQDVARLTDSVSTLVQHQTQAAGSRVSEAVEDARGKLASTAADAQHRVCAASSAIEAEIERHPLTSVLIALGVGMSIGLLSRWRD
ncbi:MAG: hypothetical protein ABSC95_28195 [Acetobacteraceae bacterium]|jgi:ElaB/YqjD/DUF883 family membrane-anchored ribosome-binding protein